MFILHYILKSNTYLNNFIFPERMKNRYLTILNVILFFLVLLTLQYKFYADYYSVQDDVMYLFYINNFPDNLEDNPLAQYSYGKWVATTIYLSNFYIFINKFIDFIYITKVIPIFTFLIAVIFIYKLGAIIKNKRFALILTFLFLLRPWIYWQFSGGLSRSFAFPLLIAFIYYLIKKDNLKLSIVLLLEAMLYPTIFLNSLFIYGLSLINLKERRINLALNKNYLVFIFVILSFMALLVPMSLINYGFTEQITLKEAILSPDFYEGGVGVPVFMGTVPFTSDVKSTIRSLIQIYNFGINRPIYTNGLFVLIMLSFIFAVLYRKQIFRLPKEIYLLVISSLVLQSLAVLLLFRLHVPSRYVFYTIPLFLMIILAHGIYLLSINKKLKSVFTALILVLLAFYGAKLIMTPGEIFDCADKGIYDFIKTSPKDSLIAGYPPDMNCIALFGQRNPFVMSLLDAPFHKDFNIIIKQHESDFFSAYYGNKQEVEKFCKNSGVTHIVVDKGHFNKEFLSQEHYYTEPYEPFDTHIHIRNITKNKKEFYLMNPENVVYEAGNKFIVGCE